MFSTICSIGAPRAARDALLRIWLRPLPHVPSPCPFSRKIGKCRINSLTALRAAKRNPPKGGYSLGLLKSPTGDTAKKACSAQHKSGGFSPDGHLFRRLQSAIQNHGVKSRFAPSFDTRTMNNLMTLKRKRRRKSGEKRPPPENKHSLAEVPNGKNPSWTALRPLGV